MCVAIFQGNQIKMRKEFVEKGGKVEKHFLEFAFFFI